VTPHTHRHLATLVALNASTVINLVINTPRRRPPTVSICWRLFRRIVHPPPGTVAPHRSH